MVQTEEEKWLSPVYSTALGLLLYGATPRWGLNDGRAVKRQKSFWMRKISAVLQELF